MNPLSPFIAINSPAFFSLLHLKTQFSLGLVGGGRGIRKFFPEFTQITQIYTKNTMEYYINGYTQIT